MAHGFQFESRPHVMGIINVTPDSFSDGGSYASPEAAIDRALAMVEEGADMIDIGGESTRPGARPVSASEEMERVLPVIRGLSQQSSIPISIDTRKAAVAEAALATGATWINDISAGEFDPQMPTLMAAQQVPVILMHMRGTPATMQTMTEYHDITAEVGDYLAARASYFRSLGLEEIMLDPGLGFAKTAPQNLTLINNIGRLKELGYPLLVGASRKSFINQMLVDDSSKILEGSLAVAAHLVAQGCDMLRVHDVGETVTVCRALARLSAISS